MGDISPWKQKISILAYTQTLRPKLQSTVTSRIFYVKSIKFNRSIIFVSLITWHAQSNKQNFQSLKSWFVFVLLPNRWCLKCRDRRQCSVVSVLFTWLITQKHEPSCIHTHMHTYTHTYIYSYIHILIHAYIQWWYMHTYSYLGIWKEKWKYQTVVKTSLRLQFPLRF